MSGERESNDPTESDARSLGLLPLEGEERAVEVRLVYQDEAALEYARLQGVEPSTLRVYLSQWRSWQKFCEMRGYGAFPAAPQLVAAWLIHRATVDVVRYSTLKVCLSAVVWVHRGADLKFDSKHRVVVDTMRTMGKMPRVNVATTQAKPLDDDALAAIRATALYPRRGRSGRLETPEKALRRGRIDISLAYTMSDAGLRRSEAASLLWSQVRRVEDYGELRLGKTKTNKKGGDVVVVRPVTMRALERIRDGQADDTRVFGLSGRQIARRIEAAAQGAGLGPGYGGHSGRVGLAVRMTRNGAPVATVVRQGRWSNTAMVALYTRSESAREALWRGL